VEVMAKKLFLATIFIIAAILKPRNGAPIFFLESIHQYVLQLAAKGKKDQKYRILVICSFQRNVFEKNN
jgi:hypothetical protein